MCVCFFFLLFFFQRKLFCENVSQTLNHNLVTGTISKSVFLILSNSVSTDGYELVLPHMPCLERYLIYFLTKTQADVKPIDI